MVLPTQLLLSANTLTDTPKGVPHDVLGDPKSGLIDYEISIATLPLRTMPSAYTVHNCQEPHPAHWI